MRRAGRSDRLGLRSARRRQSGFTLVELLVVLSLIAVVLSLAAPMLRGTVPGLEMDATAEALGDSFKRARGAAIRYNRETWVEVDVAKGHYRGSGDSAPSALAPGMAASLTTALGQVSDAETGRIAFFPDGTSTGGSVRLSRDGNTRLVAVDWFDGRVTIDADQN